MIKTPVLCLGFSLTAALSAPLAAAQVEIEVRTYEANYFAAFAPTTALDMVERVPGFVVVDASTSRGLGQGGANVLLNGRPITGKGDAPLEQIQHLPAAAVSRLELIDGETLNIPGLSGPVINVVTQSARLTGSWRWSPEWRPRNEAAPVRGALTLSAERGNWTLGASLNLEQLRDGFYGPETLTDGVGDVFETRDERVTLAGDLPKLTLSAGWSGPDGRAANTKAAIETFNFQRRQLSLSEALQPRGITGVTDTVFSEDRVTATLDADYTQPLGIGALKLIALADLETRDTFTTLKAFQEGRGAVSDRRFNEAIKTVELIGRVEYGWKQGGDTDWQIAGEGAFNGLDLTTVFLAFNPADVSRPLLQNTLSATVEEVRADASLSYTRALATNLNLQASLGVEYSVLSQDALERSFARPKGFAALTYKPAELWTLTGRLAREVGQIDFRDFLASVSLVDEFETASNPDLVPPQSWTVSARAERRWPTGHILAVEAGREQISDLVDRVPIGTDGDAVGNIDSASISRLSANATVMGKPFGMDGARLDMSATLQTSTVEDPIEGFERQIGRLDTQNLKLDFRHDIPATVWAYGLGISASETSPSFQSSIIVRQDINPGDSYVFVEHKDIYGLTLQARLFEIGEAESVYDRTLYAGRRDTGVIDRRERRMRDLDGPFFRLSLRGNF